MGTFLSFALMIAVGGIVQVKVCDPHKRLSQIERTYQRKLEAQGQARSAALRTLAKRDKTIATLKAELENLKRSRR